MINEAMNHLKTVIHCTPLTVSSAVNRMTGKNVYFKMENQQKTGAFKIRGASFKVARLSAEEAGKGVITASAGNHAQGVALAAAKRGIKAKIFVPVRTPETKIEATRDYGASIVLTGDSFDEAYEAARKEQAVTDKVFIHPFDDPEVMAGQGTIALEMLQEQPYLDTILVPVGGGGLISGIAVAAKSINPRIRVIGVQAQGAKSMYELFHGLEPSNGKVSTIAEGIAVKKPGDLALSVIREYVDDIITVSDHDIASAIIYMLERKKTLIEGAGASAFAALLVHGHRLRTNHCGIIVSGGNMDISKVAEIQQLSSLNQVPYLA